MQKKIVITGGPSSGKTTLISELERRGHHCIHEISREIIAKAQKDGVDQLFLTSPLLFSERLLEGRIQQFENAEEDKFPLVFFDRGIPEIHAYMNCFGTEYPSVYREKSKKYTYTTIFILPPWKEIHATDTERYEDYPLSVKIYTHIKEAYMELGYMPIEVPHGTIEDRTNFILAQLNF